MRLNKMFKFLKDKLKKAVSKFSKEIEEHTEEEIIEKQAEEEIIEEARNIPDSRKQKENHEKKEEMQEEKEEYHEIINSDEGETDSDSEDNSEEDEEPENYEIAEEKEKDRISKGDINNQEEKNKPDENEKRDGERISNDEEKEEDNVMKIVEKETSSQESAVKDDEEGKTDKDKGFFSKIFKRKQNKTEKEENKITEKENSITEKEPLIEKEHIKESREENLLKIKNSEGSYKKENAKKDNREKKGFFSAISEKITKKTISEEKFEELFFELEVALLENNVAFEVIEKIKDDMKKNIVNTPLPRGEIENIIIGSLMESIKELFSEEGFDLLKKSEGKKPYVICFLGINGSGKTTSIAKICHLLLSNNKSVVLAAADTFRAAAIDQLQLHADKLGVKLIKHDYGADAAAVAFDAVKHAEAKGADFVLIDTAGRMHSNVNLQDELKKIIRVANPDLKIFVGEAITGNDCVEQAMKFNETVGIDAIILTKADVDEKGGAFVSVSYVTKKPIAFIGVGQEYGDLKEFSKDIVMKNLGLS